MYRNCKARQWINYLSFHFDEILGHSPSLDTFCQQDKIKPIEGSGAGVGERNKKLHGVTNDQTAQKVPDHYPGNHVREKLLLLLLSIGIWIELTKCVPLDARK